MAYSAAKAALVVLTKNNAAELAPHKIRVNAINMGWTVTDNESKIQEVEHVEGANWLQSADAGKSGNRSLDISPDYDRSTNLRWDLIFLFPAFCVLTRSSARAYPGTSKEQYFA
jgi:NAD(P)-dependent dehydrogenase (short-subunit alcohol dehydrogenase family)